MRASRVRQCWREGRPALCTTVHVTDASVSELVSAIGWDCVWIDAEHHATSLETMGQMMRAVRAGGGADVMARPAKGEFMRLGRMLEIGAHGILYPRCESGEEAREAARWSRFAPRGERGIDSGNADNLYCSEPIADYIRKANEEIWLAVQIESPTGLEQAAAMAAVDGVDALFFGPGDYSILSGHPGRTLGTEIQDACMRCCRIAKEAGKRFITPAFDPEHARRLLDAGCDMLCYRSDIVHLRARFGDDLEAMRRLLG